MLLKRTTNHEMQEKRVDVALFEEFALVPKYKVRVAESHNQKERRVASSGEKFSDCTVWRNLLVAARTIFERRTT